MKNLKITGHGDTDGFGVVVTKNDKTDVTTDEWNTIVNALRLRKIEKDITGKTRKGFIYAFLTVKIEQ